MSFNFTASTGSHRTVRAIATFLFCFAVGTAVASAAQPSANAEVVPGQIQFSASLTGDPGAAGVSFSLYADQAGGAALWMETQNVSVSESGGYSVLLGSETPGGIPQSIFASGEARWLEVSYTDSLGGRVTQPRVLLVSVPYAMKAGDSETLGGLPASAFALQPSALKDRVAQAGGLAVGDGLPSAAVSGTGTANRVTKWLDGAGTLGDSLIFDSGTLIGIGTTTPGAALDIQLNNAAFILGGTGTHSFALQGALSNGRFGQDSEGMFFASDTSGKVFKFLTSNGTLNEWMRITPNGFVGIGTTLPGATLDIQQDNAALLLGGTGSHSFVLQGALSNGRFGQDSEGMFFASDSNGKAFKFLTNNGALNEWMRITSAGNVGVGTNAPTQKLHVIGNILTSGTVTSAGEVTSAFTMATGAGAGKVLTSDVNGVGTWQTPAASVNVNIRGINYLAGCDTCLTLADTDDQQDFYVNQIGSITIQSISCFSDGGSPTVDIRRDNVGATTNGTVITGATMNCAQATTSGGGTTVSGGSLTNNTLALNDRLDFVINAASTAKRITVVIKALVN